jgi:NADPH:quinone reductase-like Zn-dependent oxidoreductase
MRAPRIHTRGGPDQLVYESAPTPEPGTGDVLVEVHAASYTPGELRWPSTWIDRSGHDRTPVIPCHELSGVVCSLGFGATGLSIGDEVYGLTDWYRDGAAAELIAVEARNLALRPQSVDHPASSTLPLAGLTA